jgi:hypothetical protein
MIGRTRRTGGIFNRRTDARTSVTAVSAVASVATCPERVRARRSPSGGARARAGSSGATVASKLRLLLILAPALLTTPPARRLRGENTPEQEQGTGKRFPFSSGRRGGCSWMPRCRWLSARRLLHPRSMRRRRISAPTLSPVLTAPVWPTPWLTRWHLPAQPRSPSIGSSRRPETAGQAVHDGRCP